MSESMQYLDRALSVSWQNSNSLAACGALAASAAPVWGMIVNRHRTQVFMPARRDDGNAWGFRGGIGDQPGDWTKRRETCPQEGLWPTFWLRPGLSLSFFALFLFFYFINFFLPIRKKDLKEWQFLLRLLVTRPITHITTAWSSFPITYKKICMRDFFSSIWPHVAYHKNKITAV